MEVRAAGVSNRMAGSSGFMAVVRNEVHAPVLAGSQSSLELRHGPKIIFAQSGLPRKELGLTDGLF